MRCLRLTAVVIATSCLTNSPARADFLSDLIANNGTITVVEPAGSSASALVLSDFGYTPNGGQAPLSSAITVNPIPPTGLDDFGNAGIRFGLSGFDAPDNAATDFLITYKVTAVDPSGHAVSLLKDVNLKSNLSVAGTPAPGDSPFGNIVETVSATGIPIVTTLSNSITTSGAHLSDSKTFVPAFAPQSSLFVSKDIQLFSTPGAITTVSFFDQSFSVVPEPSSIALLGMGTVGLIGVAIRRRMTVNS